MTARGRISMMNPVLAPLTSGWRTGPWKRVESTASWTFVTPAARALAASPELLLMDEPFGAVDALLRRQLQDEIHAIHARGGLTIVFVTHDVEEALRLGTRVLILKDGCIEQFAAPKEIEESPATDFVRQLVEKA